MSTFYNRILAVAERYGRVVAIGSGVLFALAFALGRLTLAGQVLGWLGMAGMAIVAARLIPRLVERHATWEEPWEDRVLKIWSILVAALAIAAAIFYALFFQGGGAAVGLGLWWAVICLFFGAEAIEYALTHPLHLEVRRLPYGWGSRLKACVYLLIPWVRVRSGGIAFFSLIFLGLGIALSLPPETIVGMRIIARLLAWAGMAGAFLVLASEVNSRYNPDNRREWQVWTIVSPLIAGIGFLLFLPASVIWPALLLVIWAAACSVVLNADLIEWIINKIFSR